MLVQTEESQTGEISFHFYEAVLTIDSTLFRERPLTKCHERGWPWRGGHLREVSYTAKLQCIAELLDNIKL